MWLFIVLFNVTVLVLVAPRLKGPRERRFEPERVRELVRVSAGHEEAPPADIEAAPRRRVTQEDARAAAIYLSWLTKREALRA